MGLIIFDLYINVVPTSFRVSFSQEEMIFECISHTEDKEKKMQRERLESESKSENNWITIKIGKRKE